MLYVTEATVKTRITRVLGKLGLRDRVPVVVFAYRQGIVRPWRSPRGEPRTGRRDQRDRHRPSAR